MGDHVIVKAVSKEEVSAAGIVLPSSIDKERSERGEVVAVGPGKELNNGNLSKMEVSVGQNVLFKKYAPDEVKVDGEEYLIISIDDILAVIEN